ncbi:MAG: diguanylate cyclase [Actinomycetia bacterium]|nr:diguanylate cyclase [Actinomycetes bacterium]
MARYGGDEFAVILVNTEIGPAKEIAARIMDSYNGLKVQETSLSIGICQYRQGLDTYNIIEEVDKAMYEAKNSGGDLIKLCSLP